MMITIRAGYCLDLPSSLPLALVFCSPWLVNVKCEGQHNSRNEPQRTELYQFRKVMPVVRDRSLTFVLRPPGQPLLCTASVQFDRGNRVYSRVIRSWERSRSPERLKEVNHV